MPLLLLLLLLLFLLLLLQLSELAVAFFRWAEEYEGEDLDRMLRGGGGGVLVEQKLFVFLLVLLLLVLLLVVLLLSLHSNESLLESAIIGDNDRAQLRLRPPIIFLGGGGEVSIIFWLNASATAEPVRGVKI